MSESEKSYAVRKLGNHRGSPRLWLDGRVVSDAGFEPGQAFVIEVHEQARRLTLKPSDGLGGHTVSSKAANGERRPVIDINSKAVLGIFAGLEAVRVIVRKGIIQILALASEVNAKARLARVKSKIVAGAALSVAGLAFGGGVLDHAIHTGMADAGVSSSTVLANEIDGDLLDHAATANDALAPEALTISAPMQELVQDRWMMQRLPVVDVCVAGIPCSGASRAGKAKNSNPMMEDHPLVGHLAASFLMLVNQLQPAVVVVENVKDYAATASAQIMRSQFRDMGYLVHETVLDSSDFGCLEKRVRWSMVAVTRGIELSLESLQPALRRVACVADVLENVPADSDRWKTFDYLKEKGVRDAEKGNGFAMQIVQPGDLGVPVLRKGYHKGGSTDPLLTHPSNTDLLRKFTGREHAAIKQVPYSLVEGLCETDQHILLGQGIAYQPFRAVGERIAQALLALAEASSDSAESFVENVVLKRAVG